MKRAWAVLVLLFLVSWPASAQMVVGTDPTEVFTVEGVRPDKLPSEVDKVASSIRDLDWSAEVYWSPEPNYGNLRLSRFSIRSCQPVGNIVRGGKDGDVNWKVSIRNVQLFLMSPVSVAASGGGVTVSQKAQLTCYLQIDYGPQSYVVPLHGKMLTLQYKVELGR